jgi:hypothetical protein
MGVKGPPLAIAPAGLVPRSLPLVGIAHGSAGTCTAIARSSRPFLGVEDLPYETGEAREDVQAV